MFLLNLEFIFFICQVNNVIQFESEGVTKFWRII